MALRDDVGVPATSECRVLIVSADAALAGALERECRGLRHRTRITVETRTDADLAGPGGVDVVLLDASLLGDDPRRVLSAAARIEDSPAVILVAPVRELASAYRWLEHGASDVIGRPPHPLELRLRVQRALEARDLGVHLASLEDMITERTRRAFADRTMVAHSPAMRELVAALDRVARMRTTVLVLGESGVGKELVARALHFRSPRLDGPFIAINCAALPPHLIESELFGHERGAFTGAISRRAGKFELAHRGTLFLDEVGETDLPTQAKLLRVLEQQEFMRVGGSRPVRVDVRLVAATNANLERLVREGRLREDLYYRLKVVTLPVPPLRDRREDIPELAEHVLAQVCRRNNLRPRRVTAAAIEALCRYPWPGNVRELMNTLEAVVVAFSAETIDVQHLPPTIVGEIARPTVRPPLHAGRTLRDIEADAIRSTLAMVGGSRTHAAEILGIGLRTLRRHIHELGLDETLPPRPGRPPRAPSKGDSTDSAAPTS